MKKNISSVLVIALIASTSFAQNNLRTKVPVVEKNEIVSEGIRISIIKPPKEMKGIVSYSGASADQTANADSTIGVSVGYAKLPIQNIGYTTNLAFIEAKHNGVSANIIRADGNVAYTFNKYVNIKAGLNISKFTSGNYLKDFDPGFGFQTSLGFQLNKKIGLEVGYSEINSSGSALFFSNQSEKFNYEFKMHGLEVGLNATF